jgi:hypothetical protein
MRGRYPGKTNPGHLPSRASVADLRPGGFVQGARVPTYFRNCMGCCGALVFLERWLRVYGHRPENSTFFRFEDFHHHANGVGEGFLPQVEQLRCFPGL